MVKTSENRSIFSLFVYAVCIEKSVISTKNEENVDKFELSTYKIGKMWIKNVQNICFDFILKGLRGINSKKCGFSVDNFSVF